jgi:hypothetical protein
MSEFRIFCIGGFLITALFSAASNHGVQMVPGTAYEQLLSVGFLGGCIAVTLFGKRGEA